MKRLLIISIIFCTLFSEAFAQSPSAAIDSLVKFRVITAKERPIINRELKDFNKRAGGSYRVGVLNGLEYLMLKKIFHIDTHRTGLFYGYSDTRLGKQNQDSINTSLRLLLAKIKKAGLLTDKVYAKAAKDIDSARYMAELQLIGSLAEMSWRLEKLAPNNLLPVAEELHKSGIVSDSAFTQLKDDISNDKIESSFQLNDYLKMCRVFDLAKYPDDPHVWLEQLHSDMAAMLPGLNFTDFSYVVVPDTSFSLPGVRFKVSLTCNGRVYKHTSSASASYRNKEGKITAKDFFANDFYRIFNKILTDGQSPYRLHEVRYSYAANNEDRSKLALIALNESQWGMFMKVPGLNYMLVIPDFYDSSLTSAKIDSTIAGWQTLGLFAHLSAEQLRGAIDDARSDYAVSANYLLFNFPGVAYNLHGDLTGPRQPYKNLLLQLAKITHGEFNPVKIVQVKANKGLKLQYVHKGKIHSFTFPTPYGWLDPKFAAFINGLSRENNLKGNFYQLRHDDALIYLTKQQHDDALKCKLLDLAPVKTVSMQ